MRKLAGVILILIAFAGTAAAQSSLQILTTSISNGAVGNSYSPVTLRVSGGTSPYNWFVSSGLLPQGLVLSTDGVLTGTPAVAGTYTVVLGVSDTSTVPQSVVRTFVINIQDPLVITTGVNLPLGVVGVFYSKQLETSGPNVASWSVVAKNLPPGLSLTGTGTIVGSPSLAGTYDFTIQAAGGDPLQTNRKSFTFIINPGLNITTNSTLPDAALNSPYSATLVATGGVPPYTWSSTGGLPPGLTLSSAGVISGNSTGLGGRSFSVTVTDSFTPPQDITRNFSITTVSPLTISTLTLPNAFQNIAYSQQLQLTGGSSPYTWVVTSGTLPAGLTLSTGGLLSGTPEVVFSQTLGITVTDGRGTAISKTFNFAVDPPLSTLSAPGLAANLNPRQQSRIAVALAAPHPSALSGTLVMIFTSRAEVAGDDPMTQFSNGTRTANFTLAANSSSLILPADLQLMTGTVTGTVRLLASIKDGPSDLPVATVEIQPTAPQITNAEATRTLGGLDLQVTGYAPSRRITSVEFSFEVRLGSTTQTQTLSRSVDSDFTNWYRNSASASFGSAFSFVQSFAVQGDINQLESVTIRLTNAQGSTTSSAVRLK